MKLENLAAAVALHVAHYNFCRIHGTTRITPAMAAGVADHVWELSDLLQAIRTVQTSRFCSGFFMRRW